MVTFLAYLPCLGGDYIWDDIYNLKKNPAMRSLDGLIAIWTTPDATPQYYPVVYTTFWVEHQLWGGSPLGHHVGNVLLHAANGIFLLLILRRLSIPGAPIAALAFTLHPVSVESVAWIIERKNVLATFFFLASLLVLMRHFGLGEDRADTASTRGDRWRAYVLGIALFLCALLSKPITCSLPAVLLLVIWWKRRVSRREFLGLAPMFAVGAALALAMAWTEKHQIGAVGDEWSYSTLDRILIAGRATWFYAGKLLFPYRLSFVYPRWSIDSSDPLQYLFPLLACLTVLAAWIYRHRIGRAPLLVVLLFGGNLLPALGFFDVYFMRYSFVADHFQYLASIPAIAGIVALGARAARGTQRIVVASVAVLCLAFLGTLTWKQAAKYRDEETLWRHTIDLNHDAWLAHANLGNVLFHRGSFEEAEQHFRIVTEIRANDGAVYKNLGDALLAQGKAEDAIACYRKGLQLKPRWPTILNSLAWVLATHPDERIRDPREAVTLAEAACRRTGYKDASSFGVLGAACAAAGRFPEALQATRKGLKLARKEGRSRLAEDLQYQIRLYEQGVPYLDHAVSADPNDPS